MAQDRGLELEKAPGFMLLPWWWKQLGPSVRHPQGRETSIKGTSNDHRDGKGNLEKDSVIKKGNKDFSLDYNYF